VFSAYDAGEQAAAQAGPIADFRLRNADWKRVSATLLLISPQSAIRNPHSAIVGFATRRQML
jgi:hypothetical protein